MRCHQTYTLPGFSPNSQVQDEDFKRFSRHDFRSYLNCYDFVECGVNAGFVSSAIMQSLDRQNSGRRFFLIDTFSGPVLSQYSPQEIDRGRDLTAKSALAAGAYMTDPERVRANFSEWPNAC
jgi:hypothetical protein